MSSTTDHDDSIEVISGPANDISTLQSESSTYNSVHIPRDNSSQSFNNNNKRYKKQHHSRKGSKGSSRGSSTYRPSSTTGGGGGGSVASETCHECSNGDVSAAHPSGTATESCLLSPTSTDNKQFSGGGGVSPLVSNRGSSNDQTPKEKQMARMVGIVAGVLILASFVLVGVTLSMSEHIDDMGKLLVNILICFCLQCSMP